MLHGRGDNLKERFQPEDIPSSNPPPEPTHKKVLRATALIFVAVLLIGGPIYYYMDQRGISLFGSNTVEVEIEAGQEIVTVLKLMQEGKSLRALEVIRMLYTLHPENAEYVSTGAWINFKNERYKDAMELARAAIQLDPLRARDHAVLGACRLNFKQYKPALEDSLQALKLDPEFPLAYLTIGEIYLKENDLERALPALKKAGRLDAQNPLVWLRLSSAFIKLKQWDKAEQAVQTSLKLKPDAPGSHFNLAIVYTKTEKGPLAVEHMQKAQDLYDQSGQYEWAGQARRNKELIIKKFKLRPDDIPL